MKTPVTSEAASRLIEDMKRRLLQRKRERESTADLCSVFGFILVLALVLALTGCSYNSPQVGEAREGSRAGLLFTERELRRNPHLR